MKVKVFIDFISWKKKELLECKLLLIRFLVVWPSSSNRWVVCMGEGMAGRKAVLVENAR